MQLADPAQLSLPLDELDIPPLDVELDMPPLDVELDMPPLDVELDWPPLDVELPMVPELLPLPDDVPPSGPILVTVPPQPERVEDVYSDSGDTSRASTVMRPTLICKAPRRKDRQGAGLESIPRPPAGAIPAGGNPGAPPVSDGKEVCP